MLDTQESAKRSQGGRDGNHSPVTPFQGRSRLKAIEDYAIAIAGFLLFLPASFLIALAIKLESRGPVLIRQRYQGRDGRMFDLLRFRTTRTSYNGDAEWQNSKSLTRIGHFLCQTSLDELPQFINVLRGDMSVVGPSPHSPAYHDYCDKLNGSYSRRRGVKPGLTGWAQIHRLSGEANNPDMAARQLRYDLEYIDSWSVWLDFKIIATAPFFGLARCA